MLKLIKKSLLPMVKNVNFVRMIIHFFVFLPTI